MAMLTLLTLFGLSVFVGQLSATRFLAANAHSAAAALAEARDALIADAISHASISEAGYLRLPDLGVNLSEVAVEGEASANFSGNGKDRSVIGKLPSKTLDTGALRDTVGECLWYVVSGRLQTASVTDALNWDTQGQIDIIDGSGALVASNLAALVVAPGRALDSQDRALADAAYAGCGGNYDARNYLDTFENTNAVSGQVNYFAGSTNNRVAPDKNNKSFVMAANDFYNDRYLWISVADIFDPLIRRRDFAAAIAQILDDPAFQTIPVSGIKGTEAFTCPTLPVKNFCKNWKEMLFLTELPTPAKITIDGKETADPCRRVLIFAGRRGAGQSRNDDTQRGQPNNYLEDPNLALFAVPTAAGTAFSGVSAFDYRTPANDILRCLP
ncbi:MAG: hypothetical protein CRU78_17140 [Candidatus Accumulibacter phosphatis]|uniref:Uncharacterized protein n=1 Tax=Candidatus Accumulibacter phosphatis TaxID=327160 RepID=A0A6A7RXC9_9PROT|nr:hypothetical protein [Candidatus Accumulibacter phosphatis]